MTTQSETTLTQAISLVLLLWTVSCWFSTDFNPPCPLSPVTQPQVETIAKTQGIGLEEAKASQWCVGDGELCVAILFQVTIACPCTPTGGSGGRESAVKAICDA